jgi:hypothetical protein
MSAFVEITTYILLAIVSYWVSAVIHELGHVVVGLTHKWKLFMLVVGPIGVKRKGEKLSLYFEKNLVLWGGVGGTLPTNESEDNIKIWSTILLGGPIASIITGIMFLLLCVFNSHMLFEVLNDLKKSVPKIIIDDCPMV